MMYCFCFAQFSLCDNHFMFTSLIQVFLYLYQERKQFKKSIADFQATQFKLADMAGKIQSSRLMLRNAAMLLDQGHPAASAQCAIAKKMATDQGKKKREERGFFFSLFTIPPFSYFSIQLLLK